MASQKTQLDLFGAPERAVGKDRSPLGPAEVRAEDRLTAQRLPGSIHFGTSSWTFPGWKGIVWDREASASRLSSEGLGVYARHPLLRAVGVDRTYYAPVRSSVFAEYAAAVPEDFRFVVKAHEWLTVPRFALHPRYGAMKGKENPHFLDPAYANEQVISPFVEGLGAKGGALVFQFSPQRLEPLGGEEAFIDRLHGFLSALPRGPLYAVEVRNPSLLSARYAEALKDVGAAPVIGAWAQMPSVRAQAALLPILEAPALVGRWMLPPHGALDYEDAREKFAPFDRLVDEDPETRRDYAELIAAMTVAGKAAFVIVNNKAEGSAPLSIFRLADFCAARLPG